MGQTDSSKDKSRKQVPLRLSSSLFEELTRWAEDDFRSLNGQIEYLLTEAVKKRKKDFKEE
ncbi:MAG: Arc family DNA-binding protein [Sphaerochaetaceae bacterium]|nr:Arc family DNA-binding protein [Sphaerochaetaceae bacterium]